MSQSQSDKSAAILKSGFLWKKGSGVLGKTYKERMFELKLTGKLEYYEVTKDGKKTLKGTINLSSGSTIKKRTDCPSDQHKFVIKTKEREWYLWCKDHNSKSEVNEWVSLLNDMVHSANSNSNSNSKSASSIIDSSSHKPIQPKPSQGLGHSKTLSNIDELKEKELLEVRPTSINEIEDVSPNPPINYPDPSQQQFETNIQPLSGDSEDMFGDYITPQDIV